VVVTADASRRRARAHGGGPEPTEAGQSPCRRSHCYRVPRNAGQQRLSVGLHSIKAPLLDDDIVKKQIAIILMPNFGGPVSSLSPILVLREPWHVIQFLHKSASQSCFSAHDRPFGLISADH